MDWQQARRLLLLTFTAVNAVLALALWLPPFSQPMTQLGLGQFREREVRSQLAAQGFRLEAPLPRAGRVQPFLRVSPPAPAALQELTERLARLAETESTPVGWRPPAVLVQPDGTVRFRPGRPWGDPVRLESPGALRQAAEAFVRTAGLQAGRMLRMARIYHTPAGRAVVEYVPVYEGVPVFAGYLRVFLGQQGVEEVTAFFPTPEGFRGDPKGVLDPGEALLRLAGYLKVNLSAREGTTFAGVELGYYAPAQVSASSWETYAAWRVLTAAGEVYYVNAFTGEVEAP
ncbi:MAG: hypothetical protein L6E13_03960 [Firmicutes bacterium]|nr:hypothetical protein [Bacillota bacterium]